MQISWSKKLLGGVNPMTHPAASWRLQAPGLRIALALKTVKPYSFFGFATKAQQVPASRRRKQFVVENFLDTAVFRPALPSPTAWPFL